MTYICDVSCNCAHTLKWIEKKKCSRKKWTSLHENEKDKIFHLGLYIDYVARLT